jgi:signal transduction histidine kinase
VKYSSPGSAITVRTSAAGSVARVEVVDEGVGMTTDDVTRAFEPFWRGGHPTTRATRGTGLGLALVAEYVRVMGGTVAVESTPGAGSTFAFTLPLATVADVGGPGG